MSLQWILCMDHILRYKISIFNDLLKCVFYFYFLKIRFRHFDSGQVESKEGAERARERERHDMQQRAAGRDMNCGCCSYDATIFTSLQDTFS